MFNEIFSSLELNIPTLLNICFSGATTEKIWSIKAFCCCLLFDIIVLSARPRSFNESICKFTSSVDSIFFNAEIAIKCFVLASDGTCLKYDFGIFFKNHGTTFLAEFNCISLISCNKDCVCNFSKLFSFTNNSSLVLVEK